MGVKGEKTETNEKDHYPLRGGRKGKVVGAKRIQWAAIDASQRRERPTPLSSVRRVALSFKGVDTVTLGL